MKRLTSILAISVITVMTASAARADIASVSYVNDKADAITVAAEQKANKVAHNVQVSEADQTSDEKYPSLGLMYSVMSGKMSDAVAKGGYADADENKVIVVKDGEASPAFVTADSIATSAVTTAKIDDLSVTNAKLAKEVTDSIADAKSAGTAATTALNQYKTSNNTALSGVKTTAESALSKANANETTLKSMATSDTVNALTTRVGTAETNIKGLQDGKQNLLVATGDNANIAGTDGVSVSIANGKITVTGNEAATDTAIAAAEKAGRDAAAALETYKGTVTTALDGKQNKLSDTQMAAVNSGITATKVKAYDGYDATIKSNTSGVSAINTKIGTVPDGKTVVGMIGEAQSAATYDDTTVKADIKALQDTGVTKALVNQITTNKNDIAANKTSIAGKVSTAQGADAANKALITNASGGVTTGQIATGMIANDAVTTVKILDKNVTKAKLASDVQTSLGKADTALQAADITDKITAPGTANADITSDGTYTLTMKVVNNVKTYAWEKIGR